MKEYKGTIVEESLEDKGVLDAVKVISVDISENLGWHLCAVEVSEEYFGWLSRALKPGRWFINLWSEEEAVTIFKDKTFRFKQGDKKGWASVLKYAKSLGISERKLAFPTFPIEE